MFNKNILSTDRVLLRYIRPNDLEPLLKIGADPRIWKFQSKYKTSSIEGFKEYFADAIKQHEKKNQIVWVTTGHDKSYYGMCRFYNIDEFNKSLGIGYSWLGYDYQRTGINKHVKFLQLQYAFEVGGIERVQFSIDELNKQSRDAVQKIGGKFEGYLRNDRTVLDAAYDFNQTRRRTTSVYSIIKPDWEQTKSLIMSQL